MEEESPEAPRRVRKRSGHSETQIWGEGVANWGGGGKSPPVRVHTEPCLPPTEPPPPIMGFPQIPHPKLQSSPRGTPPPILGSPKDPPASNSGSPPHPSSHTEAPHLRFLIWGGSHLRGGALQLQQGQRAGACRDVEIEEQRLRPGGGRASWGGGGNTRLWGGGQGVGMWGGYR